jgi:hypothetical protein
MGHNSKQPWWRRCNFVALVVAGASVATVLFLLSGVCRQTGQAGNTNREQDRQEGAYALHVCMRVTKKEKNTM